MEQYSLPMKRREVWLHIQKTKNFPELWPITPACGRLERMLATNGGRAKIMTCVKAGVGLCGDPNHPDVRGIDECHVVIEQLQKIRGERLKATKEDDKRTEEGDKNSETGGIVPSAGADVPIAGGDGPGEDPDGLAFFEAEHQDPVDQKANELALKEMMHITSFDDTGKLLNEVEETVSREPVEQPHPTD